MWTHAFLRGSLVVGLAMAANGAHAALVENLTLGNPKALAMGNAVTADPPGIDAVHFNPAGLTRLDGRQREVKLIAGSFSMAVDFGEHHPLVEQYFADLYAADTVPEGIFDDPVVNTHSETSGAAVILPGAGLVRMPAIVAPLGGVSYRPPGSRVTFATDVYAPTAAGYYRDDDDPGRFQGKDITFSRVTYFSPSVAMEFNDELSLGASLGFSYQGVGVALDLRVPNVGLVMAEALSKAVCSQDVPAIDFCGGHVGPYTEVSSLDLEAEKMLSTTMNFGALWSPTAWLSFGMTFQSEANDTLKGHYRIEYADDWANMWRQLRADNNSSALMSFTNGLGYPLPYGEKIEKGDVTLKLPTPWHFSLGTSVHVTPKLKFNLDYKMSDWAVWKDLEIGFDQDIDFLQLARIVQPDEAEMRVLRMPMRFESVWNWGLGMEYQYSDALALRLGYEPRPSSIPADKHTVLLPVGDGKLYGTGFSYQTGPTQSLDVSLGYFIAKRFSPAGASDTSNSLNQLFFIYNPYMGTDYDSTVTAIIFATSYRQQF